MKSAFRATEFLINLWVCSELGLKGRFVIAENVRFYLTVAGSQEHEVEVKGYFGHAARLGMYPVVMGSRTKRYGLGEYLVRRWHDPLHCKKTKQPRMLGFPLLPLLPKEYQP